MTAKNKLIYLEDYADTLESLPLELARNFTSIRDLDAHSDDILEKTQKLLLRFLKDSNSMSKTDKVSRIQEIMDPLQKCLRHGDEKVELAMQAYDITDRHINRLHDDLIKFQSDQMSSPKVYGAPGSRTLRKSDSRDPVPRYSNTNQNRRVSDKDEIENDDLINVNDDGDLNEPRYCYCGGPSFGDMVACDDEDCEIEWFHYICVGLSAPPKGKWYCKDCQRKMKK